MDSEEWDSSRFPSWEEAEEEVERCEADVILDDKGRTGVCLHRLRRDGTCPRAEYHLE